MIEIPEWSRAIDAREPQGEEQLFARGWAVFKAHSATAESGLHIERIDESKRFASDDEALHFVLDNAHHCKICRRAIKEVYGI
jgi:hypothetical protein